MLYTFFTFIFPLYFYYGGKWHNNKFEAVGGLVLGIFLWLLLFCVVIRRMRKHQKIRFLYQSLAKQGQKVNARIIGNHTQQSSRGAVVDLVVEFENLAGTTVQATMSCMDLRPQERRYEVGKTLILYLNRQSGEHLPFAIDGGEFNYNKTVDIVFLIIAISYSIAAFIISHHLYSQGDGIRWLSFFHPWVFSPMIGIIIYAFLGKIGQGFFRGLNQEEKNRLLLYGLKTRGEIIRFDITGESLNDQPTMLIGFKYQDNQRHTHQIERKQTVFIHELSDWKKGDVVDLLYLPDRPAIVDRV
ncbi:DUF3592 domain-containing protein [Neisseria leonii]|uniref:DUF3592 domain-containing protein n=1 Tax=Neisseria leonii TaxID=2995413 RepID=A0A9X4E346_9NEIS|nr:DUF3592 domain-containing protein [Neisseria sp. 51.81]MDD9327870.1 hypothetical protein [Neisseria sp. 51.81]